MGDLFCDLLYINCNEPIHNEFYIYLNKLRWAFKSVQSDNFEAPYAQIIDVVTTMFANHRTEGEILLSMLKPYELKPESTNPEEANWERPEKDPIALVNPPEPVPRLAKLGLLVVHAMDKTKKTIK